MSGATAYARFAIDDAALLELMFAGEHREPAGALDEVAERAFAVVLGLIREGQADGVLEPGAPQRIGLLLFATMHCIAALTTAGIVRPDQVEGLVADAFARFLHGPRFQQ